MKISFSDLEHKWINLHIEADSVRYTLYVSSILNDCFRELLMAVIGLRTRNSNEYVVFWDEPSSFVWRLRKNEEIVRIERFFVKDYQPVDSFLDKYLENAEFLDSFEIDLKTLTNHLISFVSDFKDSPGLEKYEEAWGRPFPENELGSLKKLRKDMKHDSVAGIIKTFEKKRLKLEPGLNESEIHAVEARFQFKFPPDLRRLLQAVLPVSKGFYNWRKALIDPETAVQIEEMLDWPRDGILFDVEHNDFWVWKELPGISAWGPKPESLEDRLKTASEHISSYIRLIPIYSHRYAPEQPFEEGNPVFSVYQTDIIYYGDSLENYIKNEFGRSRKLSEQIKRIPFWSDCCLGLFEEG